MASIEGITADSGLKSLPGLIINTNQDDQDA